MRLFDLHCDTIGECCKRGLSLKENYLHIDLKRGSTLGSYTQVFAIWIPDELRGGATLNYFNKTADYFYDSLEVNSDIISLFKNKKETPVKAILSVEGGSACGGSIEGLEHLKNRGVSLITLTWNNKNEIASGAFSEGGFTQFGKAFVRKAEESGVIMDASHLNRESFFELSDIATKPFIASHSNADIVGNFYAHKRNLNKDQILCIKELGGLIGLNFCKDFIETEESKGIDALVRQIDYFLELGCDEVLALGSDYDGCEINGELCGIEKMPVIFEKILKYGFDNTLLEKIFFGNAQNFFSKYS